MRISDWSSDVCSSDLDGGARHGAELQLARDLRTARSWPAGQPLSIGERDARPGLLAEPCRLRDPCDARYQGQGDPRHRAHRLYQQQPRYARCTVAASRARSEERRGGKEWVGTCKTRWSPSPSKKKKNT